jgi:hypothetical protein
VKRFAAPVFWVSACLPVLVGLLFLATAVRAGTPGVGYWYLEHITLSQAELPEGVSIHSYDQTAASRGRLMVENHTSLPLYVMPLKYEDLLVMVTPDPDWKNRVNLAHEAAAYLVLPERPAALIIEALVDLDEHLVDRNVFASGPSTDSLSIPAVQNSELLLIYDQQVFEVPFSLSYTINPLFENDTGTQTGTAYMPATFQANDRITQASEARPMSNVVIIGLAVLAVLLAGGWAAWKLAHRGG